MTARRLLTGPGRAWTALALAAATAAAGAALTVPAIAAPHPGPAAAPPGLRGAVVSVTSLGSLTSAQVNTYLAATAPIHLPAARHGVDVYRVRYRTIDTAGRPVTASGVTALPAADPEHALSAVVYGHGTITDRAQAPSVQADSDGRGLAVFFAGAGFAGIAPDYLGLGTGPGYHPYADAAAGAAASEDLLRAARTLARRHGYGFRPGVLVTGVSEGGQAAVALGEALQQHAVPGLTLGALAPVSGPFDLQHAEIPAMFTPGVLNPKHATFYLAYFTVAWNRVYHLYRDPAQVFRAPYDTTVSRLFDGTHSEAAIMAALPATPQALLTPGYIRSLLHPSGAMLAALHANDSICSWRPVVPVHLFAAHGDTDVAIANTTHCTQQLRAHGATADVTDVGNVGHTTAALLAIPPIIQIFEHAASR
jgi:hypothetical protein